VERLERRRLFASYTASTASQLIAAIGSANGSAAADTITLAAGATFSLTAANNSVNGDTGLPVIAAQGGPLTIVGNGAIIERSAAAGTPAFRLLNVAPQASLKLVSLSLHNGQAVAAAVSATASGGAILNAGTLTLDRVIVQNNTAQGAAGSNSYSYFNSSLPGGNAAGGGVYSSGALTLTGCTLLDNRAVGGRGADALRIPAPDPGNFVNYLPPTAGGDASGGGVYLAGGNASLATSVFRGNSAQGGQGGDNNIVKRGPSAVPGHGIGGGLYIASAASASLDGSTLRQFSRNSASTSNKDIFGSYAVI
jgi:hypothetical protein